MGFFDLNIPFPESSATTPSLETKAVRVKLATAAMELGYSGVAYNREMKGVMSDRDRCTITPLTLASLLRLSPSLASSVHFHRDRLGVPLAAPFRQYTRLTVSVDSLAQALALNSGNPVLKTYDIVAVRPLNQTVFDHACEKSEVDIIAIDFSEKLPFRLKPPMVKAAIQRGVYFEIRYSGLIANIQSRRQIIANAKLLVDWTRGKNLIISSAASTVYDLRGPYDVANLSSLLGLSMERAKAALSKNCRALITKALRKKHFHKEAVKVELIASGEKVDFDKPWPSDLLKWDPLSSGGGDLMLEDLAKSFAAADKASKNVKSIDFTSIFDRDAMPGNKVVSKSQTPDDGKNANLFSKLASLTDGLDLPETTLHSLRESPFKHQAFEDQNSQVLYNCETTKTMSSIVGIGAPIIIKEQDEGNNNSTESHDKRLTELSSDTVLDTVHGVDSKEGDLPLPFEEDSRTGVTAQEATRDDPMDSDSAGVVIKDWEKSLPLIDNSQSSTEIEQLQELICDPMDSDSADVVIKDREKSLLLIDNSESPTENEQLQELKDVPLLDDVPIQESNHLSGAKDMPQCAATKDQEHERAFSVNSSQGKSNVKKRKHRQQGLVFPLKLKMNPSSFKKPRKSKNKTKKA